MSVSGPRRCVREPGSSSRLREAMSDCKIGPTQKNQSPKSKNECSLAGSELLQTRWHEALRRNQAERTEASGLLLVSG